MNDPIFIMYPETYDAISFYLACAKMDDFDRSRLVGLIDAWDLAMKMFPGEEWVQKIHIYCNDGTNLSFTAFEDGGVDDFEFVKLCEKVPVPKGGETH